MAHPHGGYTFLTAEIAGATIGPIITKKIVVLNTSYEGITQPFLMKRFQLIGQMSGLVDSECFILALAHGKATITEIENAFNASQIDPDDPTNAKVRAESSLVYWQTLVPVASDSNGDGNNMVNLNVKMGGRTGIPLHEEKGAQIIAYNPTSATSTGTPKLDAVGVIGGVWMRG